MEITGITADLVVADLQRAAAFYRHIFQRAPDLRPDDHTAEWILHRSPEIALRLVTREGASTDRSRVGIGVADLERERARLSTVWPDVPTITTRPGIIAQLEIDDPDGNRVVLWQDLMQS